MRRGFKTEAENESLRRRALLGLKATDRLPARQLLEAIGVVVLSPKEIPGMSPDCISQLLERDHSAWSALTLNTNPVVVIHNDSHSEFRQEANLHHEAAHVICKHLPSQLTQLGGFSVRTFDARAEEEASWLGGCLHLPRRALIGALSRGDDPEGIGATFVASPQLVRWRISKTGASLQLQRRGALQ